MAAFKVNITKSGNAIKFAFTDSDHYLYGNGEIEVPVNSLSLIVDESNMVTFRKANSNDIFLSFNPANSNLSDKEGVINFYKTNMVGSTGGGGSESGITSGDVQTMIDNSLEDYYTDDEVDAALSGKADASDVYTITETNYLLNDLSQRKADTATTYTKTEVDAALSGKADTSAVTAVANDVSTLSGQVATKVNTTDFNAYSAATDARIAEDEEVTAAALNDLQENKADTSAVTAVQQSLSGKQDTLVSGTNIKTINNESILGSGNITISGGGGQSLVYYTEDTSNESATIMVQNDDGLGNRSDNRVFVDGGDIIIESYNETDDGEGNTGTTDTQVDINSLGLSIITYSDDGIDTTQTELDVQPMGAYINSEPIATEPYVDAAISGKADTSAVTAVNDALTAHTADTGIHVSAQEKNAWNAKAEPYSAGTGIEISGNVISATGGSSVTVDSTLDSGSTNPVANSAITTAINNAKAYYISFATIATTGIRDEDWDGIVAAIDDHRPIYAGYPRNDGGILYYGVECMNKNVSNTQIILTSSDDSSHYFYTFTKNGSNDYTFTSETKPYVTDAEKTAWNAKQDALSAGTGIEISGNVISATGGGGATYSAGTNISIDTANTINCTLNLRNGTGQNSIAGVQGEAKGQYNFAFGQSSTAGTSNGDDYAFVMGYNCKARKSRTFAYGATNDVKEIDSAAFGQLITLNSPRSFSAGYHNTTNNWTNIALGEELTTNNRPEFATGVYNNSVTGSTASGQTLFSVGNGTSSARHNAFEIRQNGDIYVNDGTNDVRLQDTILALGGLKLVKLTQAEYDQLATKDPDTLYIITNVVS